MNAPFDYIREGSAIYERSFAIIRAEADLSAFSADEADIAVRMIHASGMVELAGAIVFSPTLVAGGTRGARRRCTDLLRRGDGGARRHTGAPAGAKRGHLHPLRSARAGPRRDAFDDAFGGGARSLGRAPRRRGRRDRQRADRIVQAPRTDRRRVPPPGGDPRHAGRLRRRCRIEGRPDRRRRRHSLPHGPRTPRRQRDHRRRGQRAGDRRHGDERRRQADRRRRRAGRSGTPDPERRSRRSAKPK